MKGEVRPSMGKIRPGGPGCSPFSYVIRSAKLVAVIKLLCLVIIPLSFHCNAHVFPTDGVEKAKSMLAC